MAVALAAEVDVVAYVKSVPVEDATGTLKEIYDGDIR